MMVRDTDNPIPIPLALVVKKGSNISASLSKAMPGAKEGGVFRSDDVGACRLN